MSSMHEHQQTGNLRAAHLQIRQCRKPQQFDRRHDHQQLSSKKRPNRPTS